MTEDLFYSNKTMQKLLLKPIWRTVSFTEKRYDLWHLHQFMQAPREVLDLVEELVLDDDPHDGSLPQVLREFRSSCSPRLVTIRIDRRIPVNMLLALNLRNIKTIRVTHKSKYQDLSCSSNDCGNVHEFERQALLLRKKLRSRPNSANGNRFTSLKSLEFDCVCNGKEYVRWECKEFQVLVDVMLQLFRPSSLYLKGSESVSLRQHRDKLNPAMRILCLDLTISPEHLADLADLALVALEIRITLRVLDYRSGTFRSRGATAAISRCVEQSGWLRDLKELRLNLIIPLPVYGRKLKCDQETRRNLRAMSLHCESRGVRLVLTTPERARHRYTGQP